MQEPPQERAGPLHLKSKPKGDHNMDKYLSPYTLKEVTFKNRVIRSATQDPFGGADGSVTDRQVELYAALAGNSIGLIITGHACVHPRGRAALNQNSLYDDRFMEGQKRIVNACHRGGSKIFLQINHAGLQSPASVLDGKAPLGPSAIPFSPKSPVGEALTAEEILELEKAFAEAAVRAKACGFDGVQLHCAHNYLLSQFISPVYNRRTDEYGGSARNRFRFARETILRIRNAVGADYPVIIKINSNVEEHDEEFGPDFMEICKICSQIGVDGIEVSGCNFTSLGRSGARTYYLERAEAVKQDTGLHVFLVGGIRTKEDMRKVFDAGLDMVSLSRPFISQPDLVTRFMSGEEQAACLDCNKCFVLYGKEGRRCVLHPLPEKKEA